MTIAQCRAMRPITYREAVRLWNKQDIYIIEDDNSETLANDTKDSKINENCVYAVERDKPLCVAHGDDLCTQQVGEVLDDGNGYCTLCGAWIVRQRDVDKWFGGLWA